MEPIDRSLRRSPPPPAASSPPPTSSSPRLETPPLRPLDPLPLPSALLPPKKRRVLQTPPKAATLPPPPPPPPPAPAAAAAPSAEPAPVPFPAPRPQVDAADSPPAADRKPSAPPASGDVAKPPARKARKTTGKAVPKGTLAARKAAAGWAAAAAGALRLGVGCRVDEPEPSSDRNAALDGAVNKEQNLGATAVEKAPAAGAGRNAVAACEALLGAGTMGGGAVAKVPVCSDAPEVEKPVGKGEGKVEVVMSERQRRRMIEVFVGGLNRDAKEEDVRVVLGKAGEITEVRMIMEPRTRKNKGYCFVRYREPVHARNAIKKLGNAKVVQT